MSRRILTPLYTAFFCALFCTLLLQGCVLSEHSRQTPPEQVIPWETRQDRLANVTHWQLQARAASADDVLGFSGSIRWRQQAESFDIQGSGPLGIGGFKVQGTPQQITLTTAEGTLVSNNPAADMQRQLGWRLPLAAIPYWVKGLPWPEPNSIQHTSGNGSYAAPVVAASAMQLDTYGRLQQLTQANWTIQYLDYSHQATLGFDLPSMLLIEDPNQQYRIKLLIENWRLPPAATTPNE